jgi:ketosteroid isomerase-like protein
VTPLTRPGAPANILYQPVDIDDMPPTTNAAAVGCLRVTSREDLVSNIGNAQRVIEMVPSGAIDAEVLHPEFRAWTISSGDLSAERYLGALKLFADLFTPPLTMTVTGVTDGGDRVAIEAESHGTLANGATYRNSYHFLLTFDGGLIREMREYLDPRQLDAIRPLLHV